MDEIDLAEQIGKGGFGAVYKGTWRGAPVAVKYAVCNVQDADSIEAAIREVVLSKKMSHPNVVCEVWQINKIMFPQNVVCELWPMLASGCNMCICSHLLTSHVKWSVVASHWAAECAHQWLLHLFCLEALKTNMFRQELMTQSSYKLSTSMKLVNIHGTAILHPFALQLAGHLRFDCCVDIAVQVQTYAWTVLDGSTTAVTQQVRTQQLQA